MAVITPLIFPKAPLELSKKNELLFVRCIIRKKLLLLSPEEWVRQHVLHFLMQQKQYPLSRLSVEKSIRYNGLIKRWDIVAYDVDFKPKVLVECKQASIKMSVDTLLQAASYQKIIQSENILLTNGKEVIYYPINSTASISDNLDAIATY
jgi:hypothetical protein